MNQEKQTTPDGKGFSEVQIGIVKSIKNALTSEDHEFSVEIAQLSAGAAGLEIGKNRKQIEKVVDHILEESENQLEKL